MPSQFEVLFQSLSRFWSQLMESGPYVIIGVLLLALGWLVARLTRRIIVGLLKAVRFDAVAEKAGIEDFLVRGGVQKTTVILIGDLVYWVVLFIIALAVLSTLGINLASELTRAAILFVPHVVIAVVIVVFGTLAARVARGTLSTSLKTSGISGSEVISTVAYWVLVMLVVSAALQEVSIGGQVLVVAFEIALGGLVLGLAIAFGLAGKEWAGQILEKLWRHSR